MFIVQRVQLLRISFLRVRLAVHFPLPTKDFEWWYGEVMAFDGTGRSDHWCYLPSIEESLHFVSGVYIFLAFFIRGRGI